MPIIRQDQVEVLEEAAFKRFEIRMIEHAKQAFPKHCRFLGDENLHKRVVDALGRARTHGLYSQDGLRLFLELTFLLGNAFDTDPQLPWAAAILQDFAVAEAPRVARLHEKAMDYLSKVSGPENAYIDEALVRAREQRLEGYALSGAPDFETYALARLRNLFPEKSEYVGDENLRSLFRNSVASSRTYGLTTESGVAAYLGLAFLLGAGFAEDLQFPFAAEVLKDVSAPPNAKAEQLYSRAIAHLDKWYGRNQEAPDV